MIPIVLGAAAAVGGAIALAMRRDKLNSDETSETDISTDDQANLPDPWDGTDPMTPHFKLSDFRCKDGTAVPAELVPNVRRLCEALEVLRTAIGNVPIIVLSGYRSPAHNAKVDGAKNSYHMKGLAADIRASGVKLQDLEAAAKATGLFRGVRRYISDGFVHVDLRPNSVPKWWPAPKP